MTWPRAFSSSLSVSAAAAARAFSSSSGPRRVPICSLQTLRALQGGAFKFPLEAAAADAKSDAKSDAKTDDKVRTPRRRALATGFVFLPADSQQPRGFVNRCPHAWLELDLDDSDFFCDGFLQCKAHGAFFDPATGICLRGPAAKREGGARKPLQGLEPLRVEVDGDQVVLVAAGAREELAVPDLDAYRRAKQRELAETQAQHADDILEMQRQLADKSRARIEAFRRRDQQSK